MCCEDYREIPVNQSSHSQSQLKLCSLIINGGDVLTEVCLGLRFLEEHNRLLASRASEGTICIIACTNSALPAGLHLTVMAQGCDGQLPSFNVGLLIPFNLQGGRIPVLYKRNSRGSATQYYSQIYQVHQSRNPLSLYQ